MHGAFPNANSSSVFTFGKMGFSYPARYRVAFSFFYLGFQQYFQIAEMALFLFDGLFGDLSELPAQSRQLQSLGILPNRCLLYRNRRHAH
jgi:hypothetical protein